jgi:REP element-mobilizing transposase RayT
MLPPPQPRLQRIARSASSQSLGVRFPEACFAFSENVIVALLSDYRHKSHNVSVLIYHVVCPAKYRRVVFDPTVDTRRKEVCLEIAKRYAIAFLEIGTDTNQVHFLVQSVPTYSPTKIGQIIKSIPAREMFARVPSVKKQLWGGALWSTGSCISTVGRQGNEEVMRQSVKKQAAHSRIRHSIAKTSSLSCSKVFGFGG